LESANTVLPTALYGTIYRQNVEVKNADGKKRRRTKDVKRKTPNGTKRQIEKMPTGAKVRRQKTSTGTKRLKV
jgi:hypothetical protein